MPVLVQLMTIVLGLAVGLGAGRLLIAGVLSATFGGDGTGYQRAE